MAQQNHNTDIRSRQIQWIVRGATHNLRQVLKGNLSSDEYTHVKAAAFPGPGLIGATRAGSEAQNSADQRYTMQRVDLFIDLNFDLNMIQSWKSNAPDTRFVEFGTAIFLNLIRHWKRVKISLMPLQMLPFLPWSTQPLAEPDDQLSPTEAEPEEEPEPSKAELLDLLFYRIIFHRLRSNSPMNRRELKQIIAISRSLRTTPLTLQIVDSGAEFIALSVAAFLEDHGNADPLLSQQLNTFLDTTDHRGGTAVPGSQRLRDFLL